jgi:hypothetical protein
MEIKMKRNRFHNRGNGVVFNCHVCKRRTRETDTGGSGLCSHCFEIAGLDNMVNDNGYKPGTTDYADARTECDRLLADAVKKGGDEARIKGCNGFIWPD